MKTGAYWFKFLTDKEQEEFKVNSEEEKGLTRNMKNKEINFYHFILGAFPWDETPQGFGYWSKISKRKVE